MSESDDKRLRMARWAVIGAFALVVLTMGAVAFAGASIPGAGPDYAKLPVVHVSGAASGAGSTPAPAKPATASASATGASATTVPPAIDAPTPPVGGNAAAVRLTKSATPASKGNTSKKQPKPRKREVVAPEVREGHSEEGEH